MNAERILKLADVIEAAPKQGIPTSGARKPITAFNMGSWHCGTVGCIAGWAHQTFGDGNYGVNICRAAEEHLDLNEHDAGELFIPATDNSLDDIVPSQAAKVLRHLAATGKVDWSVAASVSA